MDLKQGQHHRDDDDERVNVVVSFRGMKSDSVLTRAGEMSVGQLKEAVVRAYNIECRIADLNNSSSKMDAEDDGGLLSPSDIKLLYSGKQLIDSSFDVYTLLMQSSKQRRKKTVYNLIAVGLSHTDKKQVNAAIQEGIIHSNKSRLVRDDLTESGKFELLQRNQVGQRRLAAATSTFLSRQHSHQYGFQRIEPLPDLSNQETAREILNSLANDAGIRACMEKHHWTVGCLAEMYPDGKVGQDPVCIMGLNQNKGQKIFLRLRTDDLLGFRKILSIRKVLYHELAHNVFSDHDTSFFQLMRQIEKECTSLSNLNAMSPSATASSLSFVGGSGRLGGGDSDNIAMPKPARELAARAALLRLTREEDEICQHCGSCGRSAVKGPDCQEQDDQPQPKTES